MRVPEINEEVVIVLAGGTTRTGIVTDCNEMDDGTLHVDGNYAGMEGDEDNPDAQFAHVPDARRRPGDDSHPSHAVWRYPARELPVDANDVHLRESVAALPWQIHHCSFESFGHVTFEMAAQDPMRAAWPFEVDVKISALVDDHRAQIVAFNEANGQTKAAAYWRQADPREVIESGLAFCVDEYRSLVLEDAQARTVVEPPRRIPRLTGHMNRDRGPAITQRREAMRVQDSTTIRAKADLIKSAAQRIIDATYRYEDEQDPATSDELARTIKREADGIGYDVIDVQGEVTD